MFHTSLCDIYRCSICHCVVYIVRCVFFFHLAILRGGDQERLRGRREVAHVSCFIRHMKIYIRISCVVAVCCSVLQCVAVCCSVLQCVAVCCSVLQCVAVCCSVLQCVCGIFSVSREIERAGPEAANLTCLICHMKMYIHISCVAYFVARERSREIQSKIQSKTRGCTCIM